MLATDGSVCTTVARQHLLDAKIERAPGGRQLLRRGSVQQQTEKGIERMEDTAFSSVSELRHALDRRQIASVELTRFFLDRLARFGGRYNAVVTLTEARAMRLAAAADRQLARGQGSGLLGIPYGAKDVFGTKGTPTRSGTAAVLSEPGDEDATAIRRLERAGAPLLAKLALVELVGFGTRLPWSSTEGPARSPWDLDRWAGGSSGGSGAAVAAGLVPFALGSETAGSVGSPAAWCGITGFRPSLGLIGRGGMTPLAPTLDKPGVLAHTAADARCVVAVLAGRDSRDAAARGSGFAGQVASNGRANLVGLRVGWTESDIEEAAPSETRTALRAAVQAFRDLGAELVDAAIPQSFAYRETLESIMNAEGIRSFRELVDTGQLDLIIDPEARAAVRGPGPGPAEYSAALRARRRLIRELATVWARCDVLLATNFVRPWPIPALDAPFGDVPINGGNTAMVWASNLAGLPGVFLPVGLSNDGLPVSITIVGPRWSDASVLAAGVAFQAATDWHQLRPPYIPQA